MHELKLVHAAEFECSTPEGTPYILDMIFGQDHFSELGIVCNFNIFVGTLDTETIPMKNSRTFLKHNGANTLIVLKSPLDAEYEL
jgi:hypothetical protein